MCLPPFGEVNLEWVFGVFNHLFHVVTKAADNFMHTRRAESEDVIRLIIR
jgi:hypothetical protein